MAWCNVHQHRYDGAFCRFCFGAPVVRQGAEGPGTDVYSPDVAGTTAHLAHTVLNEMAHVRRHLTSLKTAAPGKEHDFHYAHADKHMNSAIDHHSRLLDHIQAHYPKEGKEIGIMKEMVTDPAEAGITS